MESAHHVHPRNATSLGDQPGLFIQRSAYYKARQLAEAWQWHDTHLELVNLPPPMVMYSNGDEVHQRIGHSLRRHIIRVEATSRSHLL